MRGSQTTIAPDAAFLDLFGIGENKARARTATRQGQGGRGSRTGLKSAAYNRAMSAAGATQAVLKVVGNHKVFTASVLRDRMAYLAREMSDEIAEKFNADNSISVPLEGAVFAGRDYELSREDQDDICEKWARSWDRKLKSGHTSHFVLSTPQGTDPEIAQAIGREFAQRIFESGNFGDRWDYIIALHTDTRNPHVHIMVNKHGVDNARVLDTYKTSPLNLDYLRQVQVAVASEFGLQLAASSRLSRGMPEASPKSSAFYRGKKARAGRVGASLTWAQMQIDQHAQEYGDLAASYKKVGNEPMAALLIVAQDALNQGRNLSYDPKSFDPQTLKKVMDARAVVKSWYRKNELTGLPQLQNRVGRLKYQKPDRATVLPENYVTALYASEAKIMGIPPAQLLKRLETRKLPVELVAAFNTLKKESFIMANPSVSVNEVSGLEDARAKLLQQIAQTEFRVSKIEDPALRVDREIALSAIKVMASRVAPDRHDLSLFGSAAKFSMYKSEAMLAMQADPRQEQVTKALDAANHSVEGYAKELGLDGKRFVAKYNSREKINEGVSAQWLREEINAVVVHNGIELKDATDSHFKAATKSVDELHKSAAARYQQAAEGMKINTKADIQPKPIVDIVDVAKAANSLIEATRDRQPSAYEQATMHRFINQIEKSVGAENRAALRAGDDSVLKAAVPDHPQRIQVMKTFFAASHSVATEKDKPTVNAQVEKFANELIDVNDAEKNKVKPSTKVGPKPS